MQKLALVRICPEWLRRGCEPEEELFRHNACEKLPECELLADIQRTEAQKFKTTGLPRRALSSTDSPFQRLMS